MKKIILAILMIISIINAENSNTELKKTFNTILEEPTDIILGKEINNNYKIIYGVNSIVFTKNSKFLVYGSYDGITLWDIDGGEKIKQFKSNDSSITSLAIDSSGNILASGNIYGGITLWDIDSGEKIKQFKSNDSSITSLAIDSSGNILASGDESGMITLWDINNGEKIKKISTYDKSKCSLAFSPNGKFLISNYIGSSVKVWDTSTWNEVQTLSKHYYSVLSVAFSPNGKYIASASKDKTIKLWNIDTGFNIKTLDTHNNFVNSANYSPDGKYIVSASDDKTVKLWNVETGDEIKSFSINNLASYATFSPDGKYIASKDNSGNIKIWKAFYTKSKFRTKKTSSISNNNNILGALPENFIVEINMELKKIFKPLNGDINSDDYEQMFANSNDTSFYTLNNTPIFADVEQTKVITNIEKGRKLDKLYYSNELNMVYIEEGKLKGWINPDNIDILKNKHNKIVVINNNTNSYKVIDGEITNTYNSGDIFEVSAEQNDYFYSDKIGWIRKNDVIVINELNKNQRIFSKVQESKFNNDLTGYNYKNVSIGTEYILLGTTTKYNLVSSILTGEKGWILKDDMSFKKPDLNDPVILITKTNVDENNMLTISGKIYDDTAINSFLLNNNKISIKPLDTFDKLGYIPEVGYSFTSQWFLVAGIENNVEIKVIDRDGKSYSKVLKYTPELESVNLNEFQIENVVKKLPKLEYTTELKDENGDNILTGSEKMTLTVKVTNSGEGEAKNVTININNNSNNKLNYKNSYTIGTIQPNETKIAVIDISGQDNISNAKALFDLQINEQNGFNPFPAKLSFNVEPKLNPKLEIIDYAIDDENKNGQIEQGEKFDLYVLVQNTGEGDSKNTILELIKKADGIIPMDETSYKYDVLKSGESKKIKFSFVTNYLYKGNGDLPFDINLYNEKNPIKTQKPIILAMNKVMPTIKEINLEAKKKEIVVASKISIMSDIDNTSKLITKESNSKKWAVVVGVENYKKAPDVEFAERDALVTREYFNKLLGVPKENIFYLSNSDATYGELKVLLKDKLKNRVAKDDEVYFYFSGHGVPTNEGDSYLLLNDSDPSNPKISAYPVKEIYEDLGSLNTSKSYAFLDTCFSGGVARGDEKDSLLGGTRAIMKVNDVALSYNNLTVYAATGKDQLSNSFKEQNHGLFTYYMLKGLAGEADSNKDGKIGEQELQDYIKSNVTTQSRKLYGDSRYQEPTLKSNGVETIIN